jgi:hypothetical protein
MKRGRKRKENSSQLGLVVSEPPAEAASGAQNEVDEANIDPLLQEEEIGPHVPQNDPNAWVWTQVDINHCPHVQTRTESKYSPVIPAFKGPRSGPINIPKGTKTPMDFYRLYMDKDMIEELVTNSNSFLANSSTPNVAPIIVEDIYHVFACFIYMGMVNKPEMDDHFLENDLGKSQFCTNLFSCYRFKTILTMLHWLDTSTMTEGEKKTKREADGFWSLSTFLTQLSERFSKFYSVGQKNKKRHWAE